MVFRRRVRDTSATGQFCLYPSGIKGIPNSIEQEADVDPSVPALCRVGWSATKSARIITPDSRHLTDLVLKEVL